MKDELLKDNIVLLDGKLHKWSIKDYEKEIEPVILDYKTCKKLDFKFPDKKGRLFIKTNHYFIWEHNKPLKLEMAAQFTTDKELENAIIKGSISVQTKIVYLHQLQNAFKLVYGITLDTSNL